MQRVMKFLGDLEKFFVALNYMPSDINSYLTEKWNHAAENLSHTTSAKCGIDSLDYFPGKFFTQKPELLHSASANYGLII